VLSVLAVVVAVAALLVRAEPSPRSPAPDETVDAARTDAREMPCHN